MRAASVAAGSSLSLSLSLFLLSLSSSPSPSPSAVQISDAVCAEEVSDKRLDIQTRHGTRRREDAQVREGHV